MVKLTTAQKNTFRSFRQGYINDRRIYSNLDNFNSFELDYGNIFQLCSLIEDLKNKPKVYTKLFSKKGLQKYSQQLKVLEILINEHIEYEIIYSDKNDTLVKIIKKENKDYE